MLLLSLLSDSVIKKGMSVNDEFSCLEILRTMNRHLLGPMSTVQSVLLSSITTATSTESPFMILERNCDTDPVSA